MNLRILAGIAAVLAWLWHCRVTLWLLGHPVATVPALLLALVLAALCAVTGLVLLRRLAVLSVPGIARAT